MTKSEAIEAMKTGKKVRHLYFTDDEWITMSNGKIVTEEGYKHDSNEFWEYRTSKAFNDGWSIVANGKAMVSSRPTKLAYFINRFHRLFTIAGVSKSYRAMDLKELKSLEGQKVNFLYRGKSRPFILRAVQDKEPCNCQFTSKEHVNDHLINGRYQGGKVGEFRLDFAYPNKSGNFRHEGFWTDKIENVSVSVG